MELSYKPAIAKGQMHVIEIDGQVLETTKSKEVIQFAKGRIWNKQAWKYLKECVRLGQSLQIKGGDIFG